MQTAYKLKISGVSNLFDVIIPIFYALRPYFLTRKLIDFDRFKICTMAYKFGYDKNSEGKLIIKAVAENTNNANYSTYTGVKLFDLPSQIVINKLFNQVP